MNHITNEGGTGLNEQLTEQKSIYLQISEMIETDILRGILLEEEQVPSTNELAKLYTINPATAAKGINLLVDEGLVYKKRGVGMFVATGARDALLKKRQESFYTDRVRPVAREASSLGLTLPELTRLVERAYNDEEKE